MTPVFSITYERSVTRRMQTALRESSTKEREKEGVKKKYYLTRGIKERRRRGARWWSDLFSKDSAQSCQVLRWYEFKNSPLNLERNVRLPLPPPPLVLLRAPLISSKLAAAIVVVVIVSFSKKDRARRRIENNRIFLTSRRQL